MPKFPKLYGKDKIELEPIDCICDVSLIRDHIKEYQLDGCQLYNNVELNNIISMDCSYLYEGDIRERCYRCYFSRGHLPLLNNKIKKLNIELLKKASK
jgi:hypothetical protein